MTSVLDSVVSHYHRTLTDQAEPQDQVKRLGLLDPDLVRTFHLGHADGSLLDKVPKKGELRDQLSSVGLLTNAGQEALAGCLVVPLPDAQTGQCAGFCGIDAESGKEIQVPTPPKGVLNFQAAKSASEVILAGSVLDALSLVHAGLRNAIPIYGSGGLTPEHLDLLKREGVRSAVLLFPVGDVWRKAKQRIREKLEAAGIAVRVARLPPSSQTVNGALQKYGDQAGARLREGLDAQAETPQRPAPKPSVVVPLRPVPAPAAPVEVPPAAQPPTSATPDDDGQLRVPRGDAVYVVRPYPVLLGRLRAVIRAERGSALHLDTVDLYASKARTDFAKRAAQALAVDSSRVEADLLAVLTQAERFLEAQRPGEPAPPKPMTDAERVEALSFLRRPDILDQVAADMDVLGYVGEETNKRLMYLVSVSRKLPNPLSAVILSQSGAGKSGLSDVIERLTPEEDDPFLTRLSPQSLFYSAELLDKKLVIIEERAGSAEVDYPVRAIQSRGRLTVATPTKDPQSGETRTRTFTVEARAAFVESTTDTSINPENGSRCFEISMDESQEQTKRIHDRQRVMKTDAGLELREKAKAIRRRHGNAQRLLEPWPVSIPFAPVLTFPSAWMRTRRDNARFLNLIEVSAFLHQYQRERKDGAIVATVDDYRIAHQLAASVLADTLSDLKRPLRFALDRVRELAAEHDGPLSRRQIREALQLPDTTVRRWLKELVDLEYLHTEKDGKSTAYTVDGPARYGGTPELLTPEELAATVAPKNPRTQTPPTRHQPPKRRGRVQLTER